MANTKGKVYGVSLGPGDPELITIKALKTLQHSDKIYYPASVSEKKGNSSFSLPILRELGLNDLQLHPIPLKMSYDRSEAEGAYYALFEKIQEDINQDLHVSVVSEGDISFFSTFAYLLKHLKANAISYEMIPGVPAFILAGAKSKLPICTLSDKVLVDPNVDSPEDLLKRLQENDTIVLMKVSKVKDWIADFILEHQPELFYGEYLGTDKEFITDDAEVLRDRRIPYFTIIILKKLKKDKG
ncbi:precorrin-2 C(20)-methyltransferase [Ancylomarina salipaludis]|uniref:Precorrin-2 C(20)-methyltransferase n=1 Tax=Ancylomarina salipaludis TaxID=2501299 RepID=A0A4Q1JJC3_9BACT|nr:precorrin-2 C(20)-methyltransferase [Ancylomarina salipaludis]RXQ90996.1 precorrin-2 C(20)-methyltransferase [Ancylomarina salipaludis]